ncbi:LysR family transcriptional regulator [Ramlibacter ginsenosidimutans]|uniref:LysR family transcriptional regulator n=1 Tax=Ramlibacter ginsenosidimutans TaxID=502333 RepID=A0A934TP49_9BURK|nr:LysR substrate-binding domain-containing protein [Ramlibacter ginsenosidimutans]MBK6004809.1 LysR family transcriptional regulator [Ramlibacter ginsenosidimutans]
MNASTDYLVRRLRLRHLQLLVALGDAGTMRAAAVRLHLSQPALSKMLAETEAGFGARLFERSPQGLTANALGQAVVYRARVMLGELARGKDEVDALRTGAKGVLRVGTLSVTAAVPQAVVHLRRRLPGTRVQIQEGRVRELIQRLLDGELDCVFGAITPELLTSDLLPLLKPEVLLEDELCVLCADAHPLARSRRLRWADLHASSWVAPPKDTLVRQALMTAFLNEGLDPPEPAIEVLSSVTVGSVLRMDAALLGAVRFEHARDELARGGVRRLSVTPVVPLPSLGLYTRRGAEGAPPLVQAFAEAIRRVGVRSARVSA